MFIYDIIEKKRKGLALTVEEINFVVSNFVSGNISDSQMSALLMAIVLQGMTNEETLNLTLAMKNSSSELKFDEFIMDKHSTGGVSDSTTLILVPLLASLGVKIAKMSGRSLGFTGGTIDKLEVFENYNANQSVENFVSIINKINCSIISQTSDVAYADKLIYSLRNKTATVDSIALIASSIMSKKLASGSKYLLLNVHFGNGAFMKTKKEAIKLAKLMVEIGTRANVLTSAVVSNMNTPLANGVGCFEEVVSVLQSINGKQTKLLTLSKELAINALITLNIASNKKQAQNLIEKQFESGEVLNKLEQLIVAHGGSVSLLKTKTYKNLAKHEVKVFANKNSYVKNISAIEVARVVNHLKEITTNEENKKFAGVRLLVENGDKVLKDQQIASIYANSKKQLKELEQQLLQAFEFSKFKPKKQKLVVKIIN